MGSAGVYKSQALGHPGDKIVYGGALYLWALSMENHVTPLALRIFRSLLEFCKVCGPLGAYIYPVLSAVFESLLKTDYTVPITNQSKRGRVLWNTVTSKFCCTILRQSVIKWNV